eukprot:SAG22_NODE_574_length_8996_cov_12.163875_4_plen_493_part_00
MNGGSCSNSDGSCSCAAGYLGSTCAVDACSLSPAGPCKHGGTCSRGPGASYLCDCNSTGWQGPNCANNPVHTALVGVDGCGPEGLGCEGFYSAPSRFNGDWQQCKRAGCLFEAAGIANEVTFTTQKKWTAGNASLVVHRPGSPHEGRNAANATFPCVTADLPNRQNATEHACRFHVEEARRYVLLLQFEYFDGGQAKPFVMQPGWEVDVGPGEVDADQSRMEISLSSNPNKTLAKEAQGCNSPGSPATVWFGEPDKLSEPYFQSKFDPLNLIKLEIAPKDSSGNSRYGLDNLIVMLTPVGIRKTLSATDGPGYNSDYKHYYGDSLVFATNQTKLRGLTGVAYNTDAQQRYFGALPQKKGLPSGQVISWGYPGKEDNTWGSATYTLGLHFPAAGVWQIDAWLCPVEFSNYTDCTARNSSRVLPGPSFTNYNNTAMQLLICQQNTIHNVTTAVAPGIDQTYWRMSDRTAQFYNFTDKVTINPLDPTAGSDGMNS